MATSTSNEAWERYEDNRALNKYEGTWGGEYPARLFKKAVDQLAATLEKAPFDREDAVDIARAAIIKNRQTEA